MTTSLKDVSSVEMIRKLAEMNCFEQECTMYGYAWKLDNGMRMYSMSEDELFIQQTFENHMTARYCMTPVQQWSTRAILKEETMEDMLFYFKLQLAKQLKEEFDETYFDCLAELQKIPGDDQAESLLLQWQEEIDGYFEEKDILLFEGAVNYAYVTKHLPDWRYKALQRWIQLVKKQISGKMQVHDNFERTFYGIAYQKEGIDQYGFLYNANEKTLYNQIKSLDQKGVLRTPVYQKSYWYQRSNDLPKVRARFEQELRETMDTAYLGRIMTLQSLSSAISTEQWQSCMERAKQNCSAAALEGLLYWGRRWNVAF